MPTLPGSNLVRLAVSDYTGRRTFLRDAVEIYVVLEAQPFGNFVDYLGVIFRDLTSVLLRKAKPREKRHSRCISFLQIDVQIVGEILHERRRLVVGEAYKYAQSRYLKGINGEKSGNSLTSC